MAYTKKTWEDFPNTSTPITAEALQNIEDGIETLEGEIGALEDGIDDRLTTVEKYLTATAGSNGNFNVNLGITLETGTIVNITFPAATVSSANARLSIDNGVTYKNTDTVASEIQNRNMSFLYNGTSFQFIGVVSGSNANGSYTKFAVGTMICYRKLPETMNFSSTAGELVSYPANFIDTPAGGCSISSSASVDRTAIENLKLQTYAIATGWAIVPIVTGSASQNTNRSSAWAIGRWK